MRHRVDFLDRETVARITCTTRPAAQRRRLEKMQIGFSLDYEGHPLVRADQTEKRPVKRARLEMLR